MKGLIEVKLPNGGMALISVSSISVLEDLASQGTRLILKEVEKTGDNVNTFSPESYPTLKAKISKALSDD